MYNKSNSFETPINRVKAAEEEPPERKPQVDNQLDILSNVLADLKSNITNLSIKLQPICLNEKDAPSVLASRCSVSEQDQLVPIANIISSFSDQISLLNLQILSILHRIEI